MFHKNITLLFIVTSLVTFAAYTAQAQDGPLAIVTDGLVSYWTLDEIKDGKVEDIVGDNDGILQKKQRVVEGKYGNALEFDGQNDFIEVGTNNLPLGNAPVTISAWFFKTEIGAPSTGFYIFCYGVWDTGSPAHRLFLFNGRRRLSNILKFSQGANMATEVVGPGIKLGEWHHAAGIYNGAKRNILYLDGVEVGAKDVPEAKVEIGPVPGKIGHGAVIGTSTRRDSSFLGVLDEIGIYNRALTPEEVQKNATVAQIFAVEPGGKLSLTWAKIKTARF